jgi:hypothetical protein
MEEDEAELALSAASSIAPFVMLLLLWRPNMCVASR